jgi:cytoskeletal protein RodZ
MSDYVGVERREQQIVCTEKFERIREDIHELKKAGEKRQDKLNEVCELVKNGLHHRTQRMEWMIGLLLAGFVGLGFFFWRMTAQIMAQLPTGGV